MILYMMATARSDIASVILHIRPMLGKFDFWKWSFKRVNAGIQMDNGCVRVWFGVDGWNERTDTRGVL